MASTSAQFSLTLRVELPHESGTLGKVTQAIARAGGAIVAVDTVEAGGSGTLREITIDCESQDHRGRVIKAVSSVREANLVETTDRTFELHRRGKIYTGLATPVKTRDDLSMAYTPGRGARVHRDRREPAEGVQVHDQGQHGGGGDRRHRRAGPRRHRPRGGDARDGGQGDALQGVRRRGCVPDRARHEGSRQDRGDGAADGPHLRRDQPRGHLLAALLRDRAAPDRHARHPGLPRRPARHCDRRARRADQRMPLHPPPPAGSLGVDGGRRRRWRGGGQDPDELGHHRSGGLRSLRRDPHRPRRLRVGVDERAEGLAGREHQRRAALGLARRRAGGHRPVHRAVRPRNRDRPRPAADERRTRSCSRWPTPTPRCSPRRPRRTWR